MNIVSDEPYRKFLNEQARIGGLLEEGKHAEARAAALELRRSCRAADLRSAHVAYNLAVAADYCEDFELAFDCIREAVSLDPVSVPCWQSFGIIVRRIRLALADPERAADDPSTPRLYALLADAGEATNECHLAMARHLRAAGRQGEARRILEAVTLLSPGHAEAWRELAQLALAMGDGELATHAQARAAALRDDAAGASTIPARAQA